MAILRSVDGQFYEIPDDQLSQYLVPPDKVKEKLGSVGGEGAPSSDPGPPPAGHGSGPAIIVQIIGGAMPPPGGGAPPPSGGTAPAPAEASSSEVQPYSGWWNSWRNTWGPHWHNWWRNVHW
jgi:hypothetical protein